MKKRLYFYLPFLFCFSLLYSQYSPGREWKQVETDNFLIIFPEAITEQALETAQQIEAVYALDVQNFEPVRQSKWPIILTNSGMAANGYVSIPPRKSVWFGTPVAEDLPPMEWFDLLALHETRHMVQFDTLNRRFNRLLYFLGGQSGLTAGIFLGVPSWYFEGDAVAAETVFSVSGRGRDPVFSRHLKEIVQQEDFSYQKMVNRSYRHYIPNQYELGYFLTSYVTREYGEESWNRILNGPSLLPFPAFGLYLGAKNVTGLSLSRLYEDMAEDLKEQWARQDEQVRQIENRAITPPPARDFVLWEPLSLEEDRILARKTSFNEPAMLVEVRPEGAQRLHRIPSSGDIAVHGHKAVWTFIRPSPLHDDLSWSDLARLDLNTGEKTFLTRYKRYLTPAYNPEGALLAVFEWSEDFRSSLVILEESTGEVLETYGLPQGLFGAYPAWSEDSESLYFTVQGTGGRAIARIGRTGAGYEELTGFSPETVKRLHVHEGYLFYSSNFSGLENIMALDLESRRKFQVSSRTNGVRNPLVGQYGGREVLVYSEYTSIRGEQLALQDIAPEEWIPQDRIRPILPVYAPQEQRKLPSPEESAAAEKTGQLAVEDYSLAAGRFNVHSWGLTPNLETGTGLALYIQSDDIMDTMGWTLGGEFDTNEQSQGAFFRFNWRQFYPHITLENEYWYRQIDARDFHDLSSALRLSFPVNVDRDLWFHRAEPFLGAGGDVLAPEDSSTDPDVTTPLYYGFTWMSLLPGGPRSFRPLWGTALRSYYKHTPLQSEEQHLFSSRGIFYLPGGFRNTSLSFSGGYEHRQGRAYKSRLPFSRGYDAEKREHLFQFTADYEFPLAYPDLALGSFAFLKRIRAGVFYDHTGLYDDPGSPDHFQSLGGALNFEFTPFNITHFPLTLGVRYSWLLEEEEGVVQLVLMTIGL